MKTKKLDFSAARNAYLMPYIGVMTIICIFFLIEYNDYAVKLKKMNEERNMDMAVAVKEDLKELEDVKVEVMEDGIKVTLPSSVMFDLSVARLKAAVLPTLQKLAASIKGLDNRYLVVVDGHTDDEPVFYGGDFSSNWELSLYRSISVIDFLIGEGNTPDLFVAAGHGQFSPLYPNDTPEHQAENRRVEILIRKRSTGSAPIGEVLAGPAAGGGAGTVPDAAADAASPQSPPEADARAAGPITRPQEDAKEPEKNIKLKAKHRKARNRRRSSPAAADGI